MTFDGARWTAAGSVAAGQSEMVECCNRHILSIAIAPAGGATGLVETTPSPLTDVRAGTALWVPWTSGSTTSAASESFVASLTAVRITATGGAVQFAVAQ